MQVQRHTKLRNCLQHGKELRRIQKPAVRRSIQQHAHKAQLAYGPLNLLHSLLRLSQPRRRKRLEAIRMGLHCSRHLIMHPAQHGRLLPRRQLVDTQRRQRQHLHINPRLIHRPKPPRTHIQQLGLHRLQSRRRPSPIGVRSLNKFLRNKMLFQRDRSHQVATPRYL